MERFWEIFQDFFTISLVGFLAFLGASLLLKFHVTAVITAYLLSFIFVGSNFWVIRKVKKATESKFYRQFFITLGLRFILVLAALILVLKATKIHEIYFTVSFIISYILHSVTEIYSIEKILKTDN